MSKQTTITEIYDIAAAFITDLNTEISIHGNNGSLTYKFIKHGLADYPYCMELHIPCGAPEKIKLKGSYTFHTSKLDGKLCMQWHQPYMTDKKQGEVYLHRGMAITDKHHERTLIFAITKHNVGRANDKTQSDLMRFITRQMSPQFFKLVNLADKRTRGKIQTTDNSAMLYNMIYRIKQK